MRHDRLASMEVFLFRDYDGTGLRQHLPTPHDTSVLEACCTHLERGLCALLAAATAPSGCQVCQGAV